MLGCSPNHRQPTGFQIRRVFQFRHAGVYEVPVGGWVLLAKRFHPTAVFHFTLTHSARLRRALVLISFSLNRQGLAKSLSFRAETIRISRAWGRRGVQALWKRLLMMQAEPSPAQIV